MVDEDLAKPLDHPDRAGRLTLLQKQHLFAMLQAELILFARSVGYECTTGEYWRSEHEATRLAVAGEGIKKSLHQDRLACDLNLFKNGVWLKASMDHKLLGEWWIKRHPLCRWGGYFHPPTKPDGNHYSIAHEGRQ